MKQQTAKLNHLKIAPRKVRLVASALKKMPVNEAEAQLMFRPQRSAKPLLKLLRSAVSNAKNNQKLDPDKLIVKNIRVDQGPMLKRFLPRAMGRATPIQKKMSHVTIVLEEKSGLAPARFHIVTEKKTKLPKKGKKKAEKPKAPKPPEATGAPAKKGLGTGFFKKLFRRKSA